MRSEHQPTIQARLLRSCGVVCSFLLAGCVSNPVAVTTIPEPVQQVHFSDIRAKAPLAVVQPRIIVPHSTNGFPMQIPLSPPTNVHGCAWNWPYTNTLNGYFRIERKDNITDSQWQLATNTLYCHFLETNKSSGYFRGWYMHNLYGMIPIRTGN